MSMIIPIPRKMEKLQVPGWIEILFDEEIRSMTAQGDSFSAKTTDMVRGMQSVVSPSFEVYRQRRDSTPNFEPRDLERPTKPVSIKESCILSPCGTIYSLMALMLVNSGVDASLLRCQLAFNDGKMAPHHLAVIIPPAVESSSPNGALFHLSWGKRQTKHFWSDLAPGAFDRFNLIENENERPIFEFSSQTLALVERPIEIELT